MTCSECQLQILEGELSPAATLHLGECADCRQLDHEVCLNTAALAQLRQDPLPRPLAPGRWPLALSAAAAAVIAFLLVSHEEPRVPPPPVPVAKLAVPPAPVLPPAPMPIRHRHRGAKPEPQPVAEQPEQPLLVKFITDDPEVVVYWIVDPNQGEPGL